MAHLDQQGQGLGEIPEQQDCPRPVRVICENQNRKVRKERRNWCGEIELPSLA